jgi:hypothetical protein
MIVDFEHHYIPIELARRMGINTETRTIVEEDGVAKATFTPSSSISTRNQDMDRAGIDAACKLVFWDDTTLENCRLLNDCAAKNSKRISGALRRLGPHPAA